MTLKKDLARSLRQGHPWLYRDALHPNPLLSEGEPVVIRGRDGRTLAWGFWDTQSPIAVRVIDERAPADRRTLLASRVAEALARRLERIDLATTTTFRWIHGEGDRLPGIHVDVYGPAAVVRYDGEGARAFYRELPDLLRELGHPMGTTTVIDRQHRGGTPDGTALPWDAGTSEMEVLENGIRFVVDLARGQKGGLFLDQRENRAEIGRRAQGKRVLNLFGYTGGFSLYAAVGGAARTDTVDAAKPALEAARRNFEHNGLSLQTAGFHAEDAFAFLEAAIARRERWDIVISDPPSFAPSKKSLPAARLAYRRLHTLAAKVVAPGGTFCPASCSSHFVRDEFLASVKDGVARAGRRWTLEQLRGAGFDHPVLPIFPEGDYLKFAIGKLD